MFGKINPADYAPDYVLTKNENDKTVTLTSNIGTDRTTATATIDENGKVTWGGTIISSNTIIDDGEIDYASSGIKCVKENYLLRMNGNLSIVEPQYGTILEATVLNLNEEEVGRDVKQLFDNCLFVTKDNKLYYRDINALVCNNISKIIYNDYRRSCLS